MIPRAGIPITVLLILTLTIPALADDTRQKSSGARRVASSIYHGGASVIDLTEGAISSCLKRTFSVFNPCLDMIKGCTTRVLTPIQAPIDYFAGVTTKPKPTRARTRRKPKDDAAPEKAE